MSSVKYRAKVGSSAPKCIEMTKNNQLNTGFTGFWRPAGQFPGSLYLFYKCVVGCCAAVLV